LKIFFLSFRFLYAFHNRDFRLAFQKTLSRCRYCVCCRQRRASSCSSLPPPTPSGEAQRTSTNMKRLKNNKLLRSIASINDRQIINANNLSLGTSNGNLTAGGYSLSSKRNSCL
jgi:hypothetical protein